VGSLSAAGGEPKLSAPDGNNDAVIGISANGKVRFIHPTPEWIPFNSIALDAKGRLLVLGASSIHIWDEAGDPVTQFAIPDLGLAGGPPPLLTDPESNVYLVTSFSQPIALGTDTFQPRGETDILMLKYASDGELQWSKQVGANGSEGVGAIAFDGQGNLLLTGSFLGIADFGNGLIASSPDEEDTAGGKPDVFVARFAPDGEALASARYAGGSSFGVSAAEDGDAWLWVRQTSPQELLSNLAVRVGFDAASTRHESVDVGEPFRRIAGTPGLGSRLVASADTVLAGPSLELLKFDGSKLVASGALERPAGAPDAFGAALAIAPDLIVVGGVSLIRPDGSGFENPLSAVAPGEVHVYERHGEQFQHAAQLHGADPAAPGFGKAVAIVDGTIFVSAFDGSLYGFAKTGSEWRQSQQLKAADGPGMRENFGWALAASGSDLVVGHPAFQTPDKRAGAVFIYRRSAGEWRMQQMITSAEAPPAVVDCHDRGCVPIDDWGFGENLAADDRTLLASLGKIGTISVFDHAGDTYQLTLTLGGEYTSDPNMLPVLGTPCYYTCSEIPLAVRGDLFMLGSPLENVPLGGTDAAGTARLYQRAELSWLTRGTVRSADPVLGGGVGTSVALYAHGAAIGAPGERGGSVFDFPLELAECR
jgi:hypothetical protein